MLIRGAFAFFARCAAQLFGSVAPVQDLDEIVQGGAIEVGGDFDNRHHSCPQRAVRGLDMIVVGGLADAASLHDLGACAALEEGFVDDLALCWCELVDVRAKDVIEVPNDAEAPVTEPRNSGRTLGTDMKKARCWRAKFWMGLGRVELPTSRLSGVRSNHLSYRPQGPAGGF